MSMSRPTRIALIGLLCASLACSGCITSHDVIMPPTLDTKSLPVVHPGNRVLILQRDGERRKFKVARVTEEAIIGKRQSVAWAEIAEMRVRVPNKGGTAALITVLSAAAVALVLVARGILIAADDGGE
jgi:hypothetical protein